MIELGNMHYTLGIKKLIEREKIDIFQLIQHIDKHKNNILKCYIKDLKENKTILNNNFQKILSSYTISNIKIWFITNLCKYTYTTISLPGEC